eukprot:4391195-Prymnesium_polylepis.1
MCMVKLGVRTAEEVLERFVLTPVQKQSAACRASVSGPRGRRRNVTPKADQSTPPNGYMYMYGRENQAARGIAACRVHVSGPEGDGSTWP